MKRILFTIVALGFCFFIGIAVNAQFSISSNILSNQLNETTDMQLCISDSQPSSHTVVGYAWSRNGVASSNTSVCGGVLYPGIYQATVFYYLPLEDHNKMFPHQVTTAAITITPSVNAPQLATAALSYNPVTPPSIQFFGTCVSGTYQVWLNGNLLRTITMSCQPGSSSFSTVSGPGRYVIGRSVPGTSKVAYSNEIVVNKGDIPVPQITGPTTKTYESTTIVGLTPSSYNSGYTWFLNGTSIPGANGITYTVTQPGDYTVKGCAIYPDGTFGCQTSSVAHITGEIMTVNYVRKKTILIDGKKTQSQIDLLDYTNSVTSTNYLDGMARPIQQVQQQGTPAGNDIVAVHQYDSIGREIKQILPFTRSGGGAFKYVNKALDPVYDFYQNDDDNIADTGSPYAETQFEFSPLNRVLKQGSPGEEWQMSGSHVKVLSYLSNHLADSVRIWIPSSTGITSSSIYIDGSLFVSQASDEDGNVVKEFKDKLNRSIMTERVLEGGVRQRTYSVFDDFGRVVYVIPPNESASLKGLSVTITGNVLARECFSYTYDERGRLATKNIPGGGTQYFVYDKWDRVVLTQHANQRAQSRWTFSKYDAQDRVAITGEIKLPGDNITAAQAVNSFYATVSGNPTLRYEQPSTDAGNIHGYTNRSFPVLTNQYQAYSVFYFDDYRFLSSADSAYLFVPESDLGLLTYSTRTQSLITGIKNIFLGKQSYLRTVNYYDEKHRLVQVISDNHLGGVDHTSNLLDFSGRVLKNRSAHRGKQNVTVVNEFSYDHLNRKLQEFSTVNGGPKVLLYDHHYNELGQLIEKNVHSANGAPFLQSLDYSYNIRGWLQQVNPTVGATEENVRFQDQYGFSLSYTTNTDGLTGFQPRFNGNVTAFTETRVATADPGGSFKSAYSYKYDARNQLTQGKYFQPSNPSQNGVFDIPVITYDLNGNIKTLQRKGILSGGTPGVIDDLQYTYSGNQLIQVNDGGDLSKGFIRK